MASDNETSLLCGVCHESEFQEIGVLECRHLFCFRCIKRWTDIQNTCPFCKAEVALITRKQLDWAAVQAAGMHEDGDTSVDARQLPGKVLQTLDVQPPPPPETLLMPQLIAEEELLSWPADHLRLAMLGSGPSTADILLDLLQLNGSNVPLPGEEDHAERQQQWQWQQQWQQQQQQWLPQGPQDPMWDFREADFSSVVPEQQPPHLLDADPQPAAAAQHDLWQHSTTSPLFVPAGTRARGVFGPGRPVSSASARSGSSSADDTLPSLIPLDDPSPLFGSPLGSARSVHSSAAASPRSGDWTLPAAHAVGYEARRHAEASGGNSGNENRATFPPGAGGGGHALRFTGSNSGGARDWHAGRRHHHHQQQQQPLDGQEPLVPELRRLGVAGEQWPPATGSSALPPHHYHHWQRQVRHSHPQQQQHGTRPQPVGSVAVPTGDLFSEEAPVWAPPPRWWDGRLAPISQVAQRMQQLDSDDLERVGDAAWQAMAWQAQRAQQEQQPSSLRELREALRRFGPQPPPTQEAATSDDGDDGYHTAAGEEEEDVPVSSGSSSSSSGGSRGVRGSAGGHGHSSDGDAGSDDDVGSEANVGSGGGAAATAWHTVSAAVEVVLREAQARGIEDDDATGLYGASGSHPPPLAGRGTPGSGSSSRGGRGYDTGNGGGGSSTSAWPTGGSSSGSSSSDEQWEEGSGSSSSGLYPALLQLLLGDNGRPRQRLQQPLAAAPSTNPFATVAATIRGAGNGESQPLAPGSNAGSDGWSTGVGEGGGSSGAWEFAAAHRRISSEDGGGGWAAVHEGLPSVWEWRPAPQLHRAGSAAIGEAHASGPLAHLGNNSGSSGSISGSSSFPSLVGLSGSDDDGIGAYDIGGSDDGRSSGSTYAGSHGVAVGGSGAESSRSSSDSDSDSDSSSNGSSSLPHLIRLSGSDDDDDDGVGAYGSGGSDDGHSSGSTSSGGVLLLPHGAPFSEQQQQRQQQPGSHRSAALLAGFFPQLALEGLYGFTPPPAHYYYYDGVSLQLEDGFGSPFIGDARAAEAEARFPNRYHHHYQRQQQQWHNMPHTGGRPWSEPGPLQVAQPLPHWSADLHHLYEAAHGPRRGQHHQ